jgi:hypothetical protein
MVIKTSRAGEAAAPESDGSLKIVGILSDDEFQLSSEGGCCVDVLTRSGGMRMELTEDAARRLAELLGDYLALHDLPRLRRRF